MSPGLKLINLFSMDDNSQFIQQNAWGLRFYRLGQGKTQSQISEMAEISLRNYQRIESGEVIPKVTTFFQILRALNVTISDFFSNTHSQLVGEQKTYGPSFKISDLEMIYTQLQQENTIHGKGQFEKLRKYVSKGQFGIERDNSVFMATVEGIDTNDISKEIFFQKKMNYNYEEFSSMNVAHSTFSTILSSMEQGEFITYDYPVNFNGKPVVARVYGCLVKKSWENPLLIGISEVVESENQLLGVIHKIKKNENVEKSIS